MWTPCWKLGLATRFEAEPSPIGIAWTVVNVLVIGVLAAAKTRTGRALDNPVLLTEGQVTIIDAILATTVVVGLLLNWSLGWWWADPLCALIIVYYVIWEGLGAIRH